MGDKKTKNKKEYDKWKFWIIKVLNLILIKETRYVWLKGKVWGKGNSIDVAESD